MWTSSDCRTQIQVYPDGRVGLIDPIGFDYYVSKTSKSVFRVRWQNGTYPASQSGVCPTQCALVPTLDGNSCICNITVSSGAVFTSWDEIPAGVAAAWVIGERCPIGAAPPTLFEAGTYRLCTSARCSALTGVRVWLYKTDDDKTIPSVDTIFELPPVRSGGRTRYLKNRVSTVKVASGFSFRNPPNFMPLLGEFKDSPLPHFSERLWLPEAEYEVDAFLEHLLEHNSTAPFIAFRLIQQLVC
jgi:hypothetical protein